MRIIANWRAASRPVFDSNAAPEAGSRRRYFGGSVMRRVVLSIFAFIFAALLLFGCGSGSGQLVGPPTHTDAWLSYKFSQGCGPYPGTCKDPDGNLSMTNTAEADRYYQAIGAESSGGSRMNITDWLGANGFNTASAANTAATASYANTLDLQLGRQMNCWQNGQSVACFVGNFGPAPLINTGAINPNYPNLSQAVADISNPSTPAFATVAMVFNPSGIGSNNDPVAFYVFDSLGNLLDYATLDQEGLIKTVPRMCMACHGGTYDPVKHSVEAPTTNQLGASFLPFDVWSFFFGPSLSRDAQQESFRKLNALVLATNPSPNIQGLIHDLYNGNVTVAGTIIPDDSYVPASWHTSDGSGDKVYKGVFRQYCRMCHLAQDAPDFSSFSSFQSQGNATIVNALVCNAADMPHAQIPFGGIKGLGFWWNVPAITDMNTVLQQQLGSSSGCAITFAK
jgi:hypothetical protein